MPPRIDDQELVEVNRWQCFATFLAVRFCVVDRLQSLIESLSSHQGLAFCVPQTAKAV